MLAGKLSVLCTSTPWYLYAGAFVIEPSSLTQWRQTCFQVQMVHGCHAGGLQNHVSEGSAADLSGLWTSLTPLCAAVAIEGVYYKNQVRIFRKSFFLAGALAGNPFGVDRRAIAADLGMVGGVCPNSMDAVSDRDYVCEARPLLLLGGILI